jgi:hypothetical protein
MAYRRLSSRLCAATLLGHANHFAIRMRARLSIRHFPVIHILVGRSGNMCWELSICLALNPKAGRVYSAAGTGPAAYRAIAWA